MSEQQDRLPGVIQQRTDMEYAEFTDLILLTQEGEATTEKINHYPHNPNTPSPLRFWDFGFNIPVGADITSVSVIYEDWLSRNISFGAPTVTLEGVSGFSKTSTSPTTNHTKHTVKWDNPGITRTQVNSADFGLILQYPRNNSDETTELSLQGVRIVVEYNLSVYNLQLNKVSGGYKEEDYILEASISNVNFTSNNPTVTIQNPNGFTFKRGEGTGEWTSNGDTVTWNPKLSSKVGTSSCRLVYDTYVTFPDSTTPYTGTFTIRENTNNTSTTHNCIINHRPTEGTETVTAPVIVNSNSIDNLKLLKPVMDDEIPVTVLLDGACFTFPMNGSNEPIFNSTDTPVEYYLQGAEEWYDGTTYSNNEYTCKLADDDYITKFKFANVGRYLIKCYDIVDDSTEYSTYADLTPKALILFEVEPVRDSLTMPNLTILTLTNEELNRLGDGYEYILQSDLKHTTTDTYERDWYTNNRIGVCNVSFEETPSNEDIYNNTGYWSQPLTSVNTYEGLECEFTYNSENPLYILITGDYEEATTTYGFDNGEISFTEPCIIEKSVYNGREQTGTYPVPITALLSSTSNATLTVPTGSTSTRVRLYDFINTTISGKYAIRGISIQGEIDSTDNLVLYANIIKPDGEMGQRSIILTPTDNGTTFTIGGLGDLWGFNILTLQDLEEWELELSTSNILNNSPVTIVLRNITSTFYIEEVQGQNITVSIDGEDLSYYGAFIEEVKIPEGISTDTKYLTIDGTDTNDAYRQNIREKTIEITFNISECDLKTSTDMLRQITKLLVNERDDYNRPIPKQVTFSHYPHDYFEYIIQDTLDITTEVTGYIVKAKLVIPSGTSYSIDDTVTNIVGYVQGLAPVKPVITIQPSQSNIQITETITGQNFNMGYTGNWNNNIVEIDCDNRRVYLVTDDGRTDISKYVDHNSDWFRLQGEYSFEGVNCIIRTVTYNERW